MNLRRNIKKILNESKSSPSYRYAEGALKYTYRKFYEDSVKKLGQEHADNTFPETYDKFIHTIIYSIGGNEESYYIDRIFNGVTNDGPANPLLIDFKNEEGLKMIYEYLFNYRNSGKWINLEVINDVDINYFLIDKIFRCDDSFFEFVWDKLIGDERNQWNQNLKDRLWGEIEDEVSEKMEDEEWQEENGVSFDSLEREKSYFKSYWHYPLDSLGWDKDDLCEYYKDIMGTDRVINTFFEYRTKNKSEVFFDGTFYYIFNKELFI
jgi:hypothetical protein